MRQSKHPFLEKRANKKNVHSEVKNEENREPKVTKISQILANLAQVLMLIAVIWGYQTTVKPVIQKEKLAEDIAKLQIDKENLEQRIGEYKSHLEESERTFSKLINKRVELENEIEVAETEIIDKQKNLDLLENNLRRSQRELEESIESLISAERSIYEKQRSFVLGDALMPVEMWHSMKSSTDYLEVFKADKSEIVAKLAKESFPDPTEIVPEKIKELRQNIDKSKNDAEVKANQLILIEFEQGLIANRKNLQCRTPDFERWQVAFSEALLNQEYNEICIEEYWKERVKSEGWTPMEISDIKKTDFWNSQEVIYAKECKRRVEYKIERIFTDSWTKIHRECSRKIMSLSSIILNGETIPEKEDRAQITPPEERMIKHLIRN